MIPTYLATAQLADGRLRRLLNPPEPPNNTLHLAVVTGRATEPALQAVTSHLRSEARRWGP